MTIYLFKSCSGGWFYNTGVHSVWDERGTHPLGITHYVGSWCFKMLMSGWSLFWSPVVSCYKTKEASEGRIFLGDRHQVQLSVCTECHSPEDAQESLRKMLSSWPGFPVPPCRALALWQDPMPQSCVPCSVISLSCPSIVTKYVFWDSPRSWGYKESSVLSDGQFSKEFRGSGSCSL